jgi:hypothetical protein
MRRAVPPIVAGFALFGIAACSGRTETGSSNVPDGTSAPDGGIPADDGGTNSDTGTDPKEAGSGPADTSDVRPEPATKCTCSEGCTSGERCLDNQFGDITPDGIKCMSRTGLAECRSLCGSDQPACPAGRPYCIAILLLVGCCVDYSPPVELCCANADAYDVTDCM